MSLPLFAKFAAVSFQKQITYRFDYFMGVLNGFLYVFIFTSLWRALYSHSEIATHGGFSLPSIITYAVMVMAVRISFSMEENAIYKKVQDGSVAIDLIRPVSIFFMHLAQSVGHSFFHILARTVPILLISALFFDLQIPTEPARLAAFLLSAVLGYLILFMINFCVGLLAFWFIEIFPFMLLKYGLFTLLSGAIVPIDLFPAFIRHAVALLPFQYVLYSPTSILIGHAPPETIPGIIAVQAVWVLIFSAISAAMWNAGRSKLVIQGG